MKRFLLAFVFVVFLLGLVPGWTARWVEGHRKDALRQVSGKTDSIPACPADDSFFEFLGRHHAESGSRNALWRPVCRKAEPPLGKVAVKTDRAESFRHCVEEMKLNRWGVAQCWLDPAVSFLEKPREPRTFARVTVADIQGGEVVWITSEPLAWEGNLRLQHRLWMLLSMAVGGSFWLLRLSRRQWIEAGFLQQSLGVADVQPPMQLERLLLCILPAFNVPQEVDDLREAYAEMLSTEGLASANHWYRWQVRQSLFSYLDQWIYRLVRRAPARPSTGGG
jgi:hypothetical protein